MIEVMVSVLLTAIATSGIIGLYMVETRASGFSRHTTEASILAQDGMELLRTSRISPFALTENGLTELGVAGGLFDRVSTVNPGPSGPQTPYDEMQVVVSWTEDTVARSVTLKSRRNQ